MRVSEIRVNQIRVNQGLGVFCLLWRQEKNDIIQVYLYVILRIKLDIYRSLHIKPF